ncbi:hypothetical protein [Paenibacillus maysiensis]|uniref:hypothetical protein n=1 Tax=Paenibacillus maysiensis TaxID=1155954 RepID=UPI0004729ED8|nr:hypothetical protein [Paenibacillus maysiensis]
MDSLKLEQAAMVYGPYDLPHVYEIFEGVVYEGCYFFYLENGALCLRHVQKVEKSYHTHLYVEGEYGGLQLARGVQREITEVVTDIIRYWRDKSGLAFLFDELLCLPGREDMELDLLRNRG